MGTERKLFHDMRFSLFEDADMENDTVNLGLNCNGQPFLDTVEWNDYGFPENGHHVLGALS